MRRKSFDFCIMHRWVFVARYCRLLVDKSRSCVIGINCQKEKYAEVSMKICISNFLCVKFIFLNVRHPLNKWVRTTSNKCSLFGSQNVVCGELLNSHTAMCYRRCLFVAEKCT